MPLSIITENHVFGETLTSACHERNISVVDIFESTHSVNRLNSGDLLLIHLRVDDHSITSQLAELRNRFGELNFVFLISDQISAEMRLEIEPLATIVITERQPADALISALTLAELGYHLSALTDPPDPSEAEVSPPPPPSPSSDPKLSKREFTILGRLCEGMSNKSIALDLGIRETTVKVHLRSTYRKIGVSNRTQAALWASRKYPDGMVRQPPMA